MSIKEYYRNMVKTDWVRYLFYILITVIIVSIIFMIYNRFSDEHFAITTDVNPTAIAIDRLYYIVSQDGLQVYKKNGKRKAHKKLPLKHISCAKMVNGDLVLLNKKLLCWLNPMNLEIIDTMEIPTVKSNPRWFDFAHGHWWVCEDGGNIFCYNIDWELAGYWKCKENCNVDGAWDGNHLVVNGGEGHLTLLELPGNKVPAKVLKRIAVPFTGPFAIGKDLWGVSGSKVIRVNPHKTE